MKFEDILRKSQKELKYSLNTKLVDLGYKTIIQKGFVYGKGELPVMLVAHLDTVHSHKVKTICYSPDGRIMMSPEGIGGDDRAGVYMVLQIAQRNKCHVLFCEDEEIGGVGARNFVKSGIKPDINYIVEFDRRGKEDAVFYDCDNTDFTSFICGFGFREAHGSFSDISVIAPALDVAAVNISSGYYNEHQKHEYIDLAHVTQNIEIVERLINTDSPRFKYMESIERYYSEWFEFFGDGYSCGLGISTKTVKVMPVPENAYIKGRGINFLESEGFFIDEKGRLYEYIDDFGAVVLVDYEAVAITEHGLPIRFNKKKANIEALLPDPLLDETM